MKRKKLCAVIISAAAASLLAGCQQTPDTPVVVEKNQELMLDAAVNGGENSSSLSVLEVPERFTGEWTGVDGCVTVRADAEIELMQVSAIPTGTVMRGEFTQEDVDRILSAFIGDNILYEEQGTTRQQAMAWLEQYQAVQRGEIPLSEVSGDAKMEDLPGLIEYCAELARTAPDEAERFVASRSLEPDETGFYDENVEGYAEVGQRRLHIDIGNDDWECKALCYADGYGNWNNSYAIPCYSLQEPPQENISEADALRAADELMEKLGLANMVCDLATEVAFIEASSYPVSVGENPVVKEAGYELEYVRCLEGCPISYTPFPGASTSEDEEVTVPWEYERITVGVTASGIVYFCWISPYEEPQVETMDTQLMAFSDVEDIFGRMILITNSYIKEANTQSGTNSTLEFTVDSVKLGLMRIRSKGNTSQGLLVPVWDFWGTKTVHTDTGNGNIESHYGAAYSIDSRSIVLTINAIDGTVIDREVGY